MFDFVNRIDITRLLLYATLNATDFEMIKAIPPKGRPFRREAFVDIADSWRKKYLSSNSLQKDCGMAYFHVSCRAKMIF